MDLKNSNAGMDGPSIITKDIIAKDNKSFLLPTIPHLVQTLNVLILSYNILSLWEYVAENLTIKS